MNLRHNYLKTIMALAVCFGISASAYGVKITILSDIHVTPGNPNDGKLREAVAEINADNSQLVVVDGDLTNEGSDEQLLNVKNILDKIQKPLRATRKS